MCLVKRIEPGVVGIRKQLVPEIVRGVTPDRHADRVEFTVDLIVIDKLATRGLMQPRQRAGEVGNAGKRELIECDSGHVVLEASDRLYILCGWRIESL